MTHVNDYVTEKSYSFGENNKFVNTIENPWAKPLVVFLSNDLSLIINVFDNGPLQ